MTLERLAHGVLIRLEALDSKRESVFAGGRRALSAALASLGAPASDLGTDDRGAPIVPRGFVGSVSHKGTTCVALAAIDDGARIGVDIERVRAIHPGLDAKILRDEELARIERLSGIERARHVLACFSIKEAIYKAIDPFLRRYVAFHEAELYFADEIGVRLVLAKGEVAPKVEATLAIDGDRILATARARMP